MISDNNHNYKVKSVSNSGIISISGIGAYLTMVINSLEPIEYSKLLIGAIPFLSVVISNIFLWLYENFKNSPDAILLKYRLEKRCKLLQKNLNNSNISASLRSEIEMELEKTKLSIIKLF